MQLPSKNTGLKQFDSGLDELVNGQNTKVEEKKEEKNKWVTLNSFEPAEADTQETQIKPEPGIVQDDLAIKHEPEIKDNSFVEKVPSLKLSSKKDKVVVFKKRNKDSQQTSLRERTKDWVLIFYFIIVTKNKQDVWF